MTFTLMGYDMTFAFVNFGQYKVFANGDIYNSSGKKLKGFLDKDGYQRISLFSSGVPKKFHIHRLVYELFVGSIPAGMMCCHIDGSRDNNHYTNLRTDTQKNNIADKLGHGTWQAGDRHPRMKYSDDMVLVIQSELANEKQTMVQLSEKHNVPYDFVFDVKRGKRKTLEQRTKDRELVCL
jgi:hypothetical protein